MNSQSKTVLLGVLLLLGITISGIQVAHQAQLARQLFAAQEQGRADHDELLADHSRLLLERSALSSYQNVDQIAEDQLAMRFPDTVERVTQ
jgi:cell division protein FtsL